MENTTAQEIINLKDEIYKSITNLLHHEPSEEEVNELLIAHFKNEMRKDVHKQLSN